MTEYTEAEFLELNREYLKRIIARENASRTMVAQTRTGMGWSKETCDSFSVSGYPSGYRRTEIHDRVRPQVGQYATCTCGFKGSSASFNTHQVAELTALWNLPSVEEAS